MSATSFTTRIDSELKSRLEKIARFEDRSASYMANQAIKALVEEREATHDLVAVGMKLVEKDISISETEIDEWLLADEQAPFPDAKFER